MFCSFKKKVSHFLLPDNVSIFWRLYYSKRFTVSKLFICKSMSTSHVSVSFIPFVDSPEATNGFMIMPFPSYTRIRVKKSGKYEFHSLTCWRIYSQRHALLVFLSCDTEGLGILLSLSERVTTAVFSLLFLLQLVIQYSSWSPPHISATEHLFYTSVCKYLHKADWIGCSCYCARCSSAAAWGFLHGLDSWPNAISLSTESSGLKALVSLPNLPGT